MLRYLTALVAALACLGLAACGSDDSSESSGTASSDALQPDDADGASGDVAWCIGKDTTGSFQAGHRCLQQAEPGPERRADRTPRGCRPAARAAGPEAASRVDECDVLGMDVIWTAEYAAQGWLYDLTPVSRRARTTSSPRPGHGLLRGQVLGAAVQHERRVPLLPHRPGARRRPELGGRLRAGGRQRRARLPGLRVRGPHGRLPRAALQRRRLGRSPRTATRRPQIDSPEIDRDARSSWPTASPAAPCRRPSRPTMEEDSRRAVRGRPARPSCATGRTPTRSAKESHDRRQVRDHDVPELRRRPGFRRARRLQPRDLEPSPTTPTARSRSRSS